MSDSSAVVAKSQARQILPVIQNNKLRHGIFQWPQIIERHITNFTAAEDENRQANDNRGCSVDILLRLSKVIHTVQPPYGVPNLTSVTSDVIPAHP